MHFVNWPELQQKARIKMKGYYIESVKHNTFDEELLDEIYKRYENSKNWNGEKLEAVVFTLNLTMFNIFSLAMTDLREDIAILKITADDGLDTSLYMAIYNDCLICAEYDAAGFITGFICSEPSTNNFLAILTSEKTIKMKILLPNKEEYLKE